VPSGADARGTCAKVSASSILAKLGHLPMLKGGQYHFSGTVNACVPKSAMDGKHAQERAIFVLKFLGAMAAAGSDKRVTDHSARKGNDFVSLDTLPDGAVVPSYCIRIDGSDGD